MPKPIDRKTKDRDNSPEALRKLVLERIKAHKAQSEMVAQMLKSKRRH
jgi:hypothetical protein